MEIYHVLNRGVDKRQIFTDKQDYLRFIHDIYELNNQDRVETTYQNFRDYGDKGKVAKVSKKSKKLLVDIMAFCLMPNHYHIVLAPRVKNGIPRFMQKVNMAYSKYFNQKHKRTGTLFQGRYKSVLVTNDTHFLHLPFYVHFNPLDLVYPEWRDNKLSDPKKALEFLRSYRWSSHLDYLGIKNFPYVLNKKPLMEIFNNYKDYTKLVENYLKDIQIDQEVVLE